MSPDHAPGPTVDVAGHDVWLEGDSWYADIVLDGVAEGSYCPMVQLALGRYQPNSLDGLLLSDLVRTDFVPVMPDRTLRVDPVSVPGHVVVTLVGLNPDNRVDVVVEQGPGGADAPVALDVTSPADDGVWRAVPGEVASGPLNDAITVPVPVAGPMRVRVREVEAVPGAPVAGPGSFDELTERVVFTDAVALS